MRVAVIDMGTNTFHLLIVDVEGTDFHIVFREKSAVKLGANGINHGKITEDAFERSLATLREFKKIITDHGVARIFATATSAVRNAHNGSELVTKIGKETGIDVRVITGIEEAEYIYYGVTRALKIGTEKSLIMDIGGGSIEFILATDKEVFWKRSFEIGGLRMYEKFHQTDPINTDEIGKLRAYLSHNLQELFEACALHAPKVLIGSSGTFDTLSEIHQQKEGIKVADDATEFPLSLDAFYALFDELIAKNRAERLAIPGMIPMRVDMIVVASILIKFVIDKLKIRGIRVSAFALKEGVLLRTVTELDQTAPVTDYSS